MKNKYANIKAYIVGLKKKIGLENRLSKVETLVLGSSHGQYSFVSNRKEYNLCLPSQDLYYSFLLYQKYCRQLKNLKNVVLYYSVFSKGYELIKTKEDFRCYHYQKIFQIKPPRQCYEKKLQEKYGCYEKYIDDAVKDVKVAKNYRGQNPDVRGVNVWRIGQIDPSVRAKKAYQHHERKHIQEKYIKRMIELAQKNHHHVTLILSPAHRDYKKTLPAEKDLFSSVFEIADLYQDQITFLNFYHRDDFTNEMWWDYDHLNPHGAKEFTKLYRLLIKEKQ